MKQKRKDSHLFTYVDQFHFTPLTGYNPDIFTPFQFTFCHFCGIAMLKCGTKGL